jgi:hypothetical protein
MTKHGWLCFTRLLRLNSFGVTSLVRGAINVSHIILGLHGASGSAVKLRVSGLQLREVTFSFRCGPELAERVWPASVDHTFPGGIAHAFSQHGIRG